MEAAPTSPYVEVRDGGYYLSGTRIGLDVIVHEFESGKSPEAILQSHSSADRSPGPSNVEIVDYH